MQVQVEENFFPQYVDYDNPNPNEEDVELEFYAEYYASVMCMADNTDVCP